MRWLTLFIAAITLLSCTKPANFRTEDAQMLKIEDLPTDFKMPAKIWDLVEKTGDEKAEKSEKGEKGTPEAGSAGIFYSTAKVFLTEKNEKILQTPAYEIELPRGGGGIDLATYLTSNQGTFYVGFELPEEFQTGKNFKAFYISQARKRKLEDRVFGAGCNQYFEITPKFLEMMKTEGIKANTTRQRHVTVLAGHYIFSVMKDNRIYITQVTITDSRYKNLLCEAQ